MATSSKLVLLTVAAILLAAMLVDARPQHLPQTRATPIVTRSEAGNRPSPDLREPVACGVPGDVGTWYPSVPASIAGAFSLSFLLFLVSGRLLSRALQRLDLRPSQLVPFALLATIAGASVVARLLSGLYPPQSAAVPTQGEVTAVLYVALIPFWLIATTNALLRVQRVAARKHASTAQPN